MKSALRHRLELAAARVCRRLLLRTTLQEVLHREQFFYDAAHYLAFNGIDGDYVEFGCHGSRTFAMAYHHLRKHGLPARLWAYDSFQGLPAPGGNKDDHPGWKAGRMRTELEEFHRLCAARGVPRHAYEVVPGFYEETIGQAAPGGSPERIALAYIDCDLHSSTAIVLRFLEPRLRPGMIVAFDDYFCHSLAGASGERMALLEFLAGNPRWNFLAYIQFGWHGQSFIVEDRASLTAVSRDRATFEAG